jgi:hypothetical protein
MQSMPLARLQKDKLGLSCGFKLGVSSEQLTASKRFGGAGANKLRQRVPAASDVQLLECASR